MRRALRELLKRYRTQKELAETLGVAQQTISAMLGGAVRPGVYFTTRIARVNTSPLDALLSGAMEQAAERSKKVNCAEPPLAGSCADEVSCSRRRPFWELL